MSHEPDSFPAPAKEPLLAVAEIPAWKPDPRSFVRLSHSTVLWIKSGTGTLQVEGSSHGLAPGTWVFLAPYQPFGLRASHGLAGWALHFHYAFFCIEKYGKEVGCDQVLFNTPYRTPLVHPGRRDAGDMAWLLDRLRREASGPDMARHTLMESYLKAFLVLATRSKLGAEDGPDRVPGAGTAVTGTLRRLVEENFRAKRAPKDYAGMLRLSPKALGRLTKSHWGKTLTQVLQERMMIEAKRELYLTDKPIKRIARDLGFNDEYYFSRFFKKLAGVSPQGYRETVGEGQG